MASPNPSFAELCRHPASLLAFGFGSGLSPKMPGTMGTLAAIPFYWLMIQTPLWAYLGMVVIAFFVGIYFCESASKRLGVHDHGGIVWDEFVGFWITMIAVPVTWYWVLLGFVLFRLFDIVKPWPISWADKKIGGGFGIMVDDVLAAVGAGLCLQAAVYFRG